MLKPFRAGLTALSLVLAQAACAQAARATVDADPALWVVKDADTTVYLFGTVHVLKPGLSWFDEAVRAAFDRSDTLMLEMVEPDAATMRKLVMAKGFNPSGRTLTEKLPADKRAAVAAALGKAGLPAQAYDRMDPWMAAVTLSMAPIQRMGYQPESGAEKSLARAAKDAGKAVEGFETAEQQLGFFDALPEPAQVRFLVSSVEDMPELAQEMERMVSAWAKGDADGLAAVLNDNLKDSPEVAEALLTDRNRNWAAAIRDRMARPGTVFVAVGAGHLAGADSVQAQLKGYGLNAVRVKY